MNIKLHIERLVLDGIDIKPHQTKELKVAVETELRRQLANHGPGPGLQSKNNRESVTGGVISNESPHRAANFGKQIGNAVYRGIGK